MKSSTLPEVFDFVFGVYPHVAVLHIRRERQKSYANTEKAKKNSTKAKETSTKTKFSYREVETDETSLGSFCQREGDCGRDD